MKSSSCTEESSNKFGSLIQNLILDSLSTYNRNTVAVSTEKEDSKIVWEDVIEAAVAFARFLEENECLAIVDVYDVKTSLELLPPLVLGINISGRSWSSVDSPDFVCSAISDSEIPSSDVVTQILGKTIYLRRCCGHKRLPEHKDIAYVVATSGSTGEQKIVRATYGAILPNMNDFMNLYQITGNDLIFLAAPLSFDPSAVDLYLSFISKAALLITPPPIKSNPEKLVNVLFVQNRITIIQCTPTLFCSLPERLLNDLVFSDDTSLRILALGGEPFPRLDFGKYPSVRSGKTRVFNLYGITEVSCWATVEEVNFGGCDGIKRRKTEVEISLGNPLSHTEVQLKLGDGSIVKEGSGEIFIGSSSRICLVGTEDPSTAPVFRATGDVGKYINGKLYYLGRKDQIVKRFGRKVNLTKLESAALETGFIRFAVGLTSDGKLYLIINSEGRAEELERILRGRLDPYHVPDEIVEIGKLPVTSHGKVNKKALLDFIGKRQVPEKIPLPTCEEIKEFIKGEWSSFCRRSGDPGTDENFILSGGNSVSCVQFAASVEKFTGRVHDQLLDLLINRTLKDVTDYVIGNSSISMDADASVSIERISLGISSQTSVRDRSFLELSRGRSPVIGITTSSMSVNPVMSALWKFNMHKCVDASPLVVKFEDGRLLVFIGSHSHGFSAINGFTGERIWTAELGGRIESSAAISKCGNTVFVGCYDGCLYALSVQTGACLWKYETDGEVKSSPFVSNCGRSVLVGSHDKHLYSLDAKTGLLQWKVKLGNASVFSSPLTSTNGELVFFGALDGTAAAVYAGEIKWKKKFEKPIFSSPLVIENLVIFGSVDGVVYGLDLEGNEVFRFAASGPIFSSFSTLPGPSKRILFGSHDHKLYCISSSTGKLDWVVDFNSPVYSTPFPFIFKGRMLIAAASTDGLLKLVDAENGEVKSSFLFEKEIFSSPVVYEDILYVGCRDNYVYAIRIKDSQEASCGAASSRDDFSVSFRS